MNTGIAQSVTGILAAIIVEVKYELSAWFSPTRLKKLDTAEIPWYG
jgi:hypothetical protein